MKQYEVAIKTFSISAGEKIPIENLESLVEEAKKEMCATVQFGEKNNDAGIMTIKFKRIMSAESIVEIKNTPYEEDTE
jgi:hypothetical protein